MFQCEYNKLIQEVNKKIQSEIDALSEQEKYWSEDQKKKAKEIQQLIKWLDCINSYGGHEPYTEPLMQYFSPNFEEELLR